MIDSLAELMGQIMTRAAELSDNQSRSVFVAYDGGDKLNVQVELSYEGIKLPAPIYLLAAWELITEDLLIEILDKLNAWAELEAEILLDNIALMQVKDDETI